MSRENLLPLAPEITTSGILIGEFGRLCVELAESRKLAEYWMRMASHDPLTGLYTKSAITENIEERMEGDEPFGVIALDLDGFKNINDKFGHNRGDRVLSEFGPFLSGRFTRQGEEQSHETLRPKDKPNSHIGRTGGDEFNISVNLRHASKKAAKVEMESMLDYSRSVLDNFVTLQPNKIRNVGFNISMGGAIWLPGSKLTAKKLLHRADQNMYKDKLARGQSR